MIEKITVSRDEVLRYPWLDHTWVYVHITQDDVTKTVRFQNMLTAFLRYGIKETTGQDFQGMTFNDGYLFIQYDTDDIVDILKHSCEWLLKNAKVKNPTSPEGRYIFEQKDRLAAFLRETHAILEEKTYRYYFQRSDGMN